MSAKKKTAGSYAFQVAPASNIKLKDYDPDHTAGLDKDTARERFDALSVELGALQEQLYAAGQHAVLVVLQGMDTSGKDGTIRHVLRDINPQGCRVESFKPPTDEELAHDFLWRVHNVTPRKGIFGVFNRSHYEDVLVARVRKIVPPEVWEKRYDHINDFEALLAGNNTVIIKFFLYISKDEQERRLLARERDTSKAWKLSADDWRERDRWNEYMRAYEDALGRCSTEVAPWYIVPANKKWYRDLAVGAALVDTLRAYRPIWTKTLVTMSKTRLAALETLRRR